MSRSSDRTDAEMKRLGVNSMIDFVKIQGERVKIAMYSFRTPADAATARTPESEKPDMIPLVLPPDYESRRLIAAARADEETLDRMINAGVPEADTTRYMAQIALLRTKAISLHLGIEE